MDIEFLIDKYQLTDSEATVLQTIEKNREQLKNLGIRKLAQEAFVSSATIVNMAKKMGFSGYSELVFSFSNPSELSVQAKTFSKEDEVRFIELLTKYKDKRIMILGSGFSQNIANYFSEALNIHGFRATANSHLEYLRQNVSDQSLIFVISNSGDTVRLVELMGTAREHQIPVIAFVGDAHSKLGELATLTISTETYMNKNIQEFAPNLFFGTALNQFELLLSAALKAIFR